MKHQVLAAVAACTLTASAALAETRVVDANEAGLQEIIVTAEKISQSVEKVPLSVTVFDQAKLQQMGAQSFTDYAASVPALSFESLAPGEQRVLLRGVSDGVDTGLRGDTQNVTGIYIDDMVVSNNATSPDLNLFDVDRVEVLKGPQGTLYGDGSVGGLLRIITHKADLTKTEGEIEATGASINQGGGDYSLNGMYNVPLVQDKLALRIVGQYRDNQGFIDDVRHGLKDVNNMRQIGGRASLRWRPQDDFDVTASMLYQKTALGNDNDFNVFAGELNRNSYFEEPKLTSFTLSNVTADWQLGWASLLSSSSYAVYDRQDTEDSTAFLDVAFANDFGVPGIDLPSFSRQRQHSKTFSQEFRLSSPADQRIAWLGGLYFNRSDEVDSELDVSQGIYNFFANTLGIPITGTPVDVGPVPDIDFRDFDDQIHRRHFATFGEATYHFTDRLTATLGARWFRDEQRTSENPGGIFSNFSPIVHVEKSASDHNQVFRARLADQLTDDALLYLLASQGYRSGGLNPLNPFTPPDFPQAFEPDKLWNYEFGWKTRWLDRRLKFDGSLFYIDWSNEQIEVSLPGGFSAITNAGKTTIKGIEADFSVNVLEGLELGLGGSYIDAKLDRDLIENPQDPVAQQVLIGAAGDHLTGVPKTQGNVYAQWHFPLTEGVQGVLRSELQYVGKTARYFAHDTQVPTPADDFASYGDYSLVNVRAGAAWKDLSLTLFVKNLADKRAVLFRGLQGTSVTPTRDDIYVAQPRTIGLTVSKSF
jgi:iron complex outermembrane recepter protein